MGSIKFTGLNDPLTLRFFHKGKVYYFLVHPNDMLVCKNGEWLIRLAKGKWIPIDQLETRIVQFVNELT